MTEKRAVHAGRAFSVQAEHPDPAVPATLAVQSHVAFYGATPAWPTAMIEPCESELARWSELWRYGQAAVWARTQREQSVASLVRLEQRCSHRRPSAWAIAELGRLRDELGLVN
ncbi:MAG TPA: hypothetical protein VL595_27585 [Pseudonocardia sp.]|nr:hypothetical protein [Pseudonocardia sp.]